jgi:hypothetical protein
MLKKTNDDAHRLTIALSLQHQLAALEESEIPEPTPTFLTRSLSLMGLAPTPTEATQTILVRLIVNLETRTPRWVGHGFDILGRDDSPPGEVRVPSGPVHHRAGRRVGVDLDQTAQQLGPQGGLSPSV